jgi:hypothetical protein
MTDDRTVAGVDARRVAFPTDAAATAPPVAA